MDVNSSSVAYSSPATYAAKQDQSTRQAADAESDDIEISTAPVSQTDGQVVESDDGDGPEAAPVSESAPAEDTRDGADDGGGVDILV